MYFLDNYNTACILRMVYLFVTLVEVAEGDLMDAKT